MPGAATMAPLDFAYHRALAPMMWAFLVLASLELLVGHVLISLWSVPVALVLSALTLATIVWLVLLIRSFRRLPVLLDEEGLLMRSGNLTAVRLPIDQIAAVRGDFPSEALKSRAVLNLAMMSYPNVLIDLKAPIARGRRTISHVAHRLDDPSGFIAALRRLTDGPGRPEATS
jgi:hypothetical protein